MLTITCVPLFLMVNGALTLNKPFSKEKWLHRLLNLIALTVLWKSILVIFCHFFWELETVSLTPASLLGFILGGGTPYGQLGYTWFLDMYIGWQALFPLWKHLYDYKNGKYLIPLFIVIAVCPFGGETLVMLTQPLETFIGIQNLSATFSHLINYSPFSNYAIYLMYFFLGGLLYKQFSKSYAGGHTSRFFPVSKELLYVAGLLSFLVLFAVNRYQAAYLGQRFDIAQKYNNIFTVVFVSALFVASLSRPYKLSPINSLYGFIGKRTFGIYIIQVIPMRIIDVLVCNGQAAGYLIPNGSGMPPFLAMIYLESLIIIAVIVTAACIAAMEHAPILKKLLPK